MELQQGAGVVSPLPIYNIQVVFPWFILFTVVRCVFRVIHLHIPSTQEVAGSLIHTLGYLVARVLPFN